MIYSEEAITVQKEFVKVDIKQSILLKYNIGLVEYFLLKEIERISETKDITSAKFISDIFPSVFPTKRVSRTVLENLTTNGFLKKHEDKDLFNQNTFTYTLTELGWKSLSDTAYVPKYSKEDYFKAMQVINSWNDIKQCSTHSVKPYGDIQSKTVEMVIKYISELLKGGVLKWYIEEDPTEKFTVQEIVNIIEDYTLSFKKEYLPEDKKVLPKSLPNFFNHYKNDFSTFFDICYNGVKKRHTTMDTLKETGISANMLKKAYSVLSATGEAKEMEKLEIQKNIVRTYRKWKVAREVELDDLYSWKKVYREKIIDFNMFLYEYLSYIDREVGKGNAKTGFLSFNRSNQILEGFSKYLVDKFNIWLFPTAKRIEQIQKSKIYVDK